MRVIVKAEIDKLVIGEVSEPFVIKGHHTIIKLIKRFPKTPMPLDHVSDQIAKMIEKDEFSRLRNEYLATLKERSTITVNNRAWEKIKKELSDVHVGKEN